MAETANELLRDALIRHQVGLMMLGGAMRNRVLRILDATERDLKEQIEQRLRNMAGNNVDLTRGTASYRRLLALQEAVRKIRSEAFVRAAKLWQGELGDLAVKEPAFLAAAATATSPVVLDLVLPNVRGLRGLVSSSPFQGKLLSAHVSNLKQADIGRINTAIRIGLIQGEPLSSIVTRVVGTRAFRGTNGATQATRAQVAAMTRTAVNHFATNARSQMAQANSDLFDTEVYVATLDARTTTTCAALDGKRFPVGEGPHPPTHFNCRSTRVAYIGDESSAERPMKQSTERELLREFAEGKGFSAPASRGALPYGSKGAFDDFARRRVRELTGRVPAATTYNEFLRRQTTSFQEEVLGRTRAQLFRRGQLPVDRFVDPSGRELTIAELARKESAAFIAAGLDPGDFLK